MGRRSQRRRRPGWRCRTSTRPNATRPSVRNATSRCRRYRRRLSRQRFHELAERVSARFEGAKWSKLAHAGERRDGRHRDGGCGGLLAAPSSRSPARTSSLPRTRAAGAISSAASPMSTPIALVERGRERLIRLVLAAAAEDECSRASGNDASARSAAANVRRLESLTVAHAAELAYERSDEARLEGRQRIRDGVVGDPAARAAAVSRRLRSRGCAGRGCAARRAARRRRRTRDAAPRPARRRNRADDGDVVTRLPPQIGARIRVALERALAVEVGRARGSGGTAISGSSVWTSRAGTTTARTPPTHRAGPCRERCERPADVCRPPRRSPAERKKAPRKLARGRLCRSCGSRRGSRLGSSRERVDLAPDGHAARSGSVHEHRLAGTPGSSRRHRSPAAGLLPAPREFRHRAWRASPRQAPRRGRSRRPLRPLRARASTRRSRAGETRRRGHACRRARHSRTAGRTAEVAVRRARSRRRRRSRTRSRTAP